MDEDGRFYEGDTSASLDQLEAEAQGEGGVLGFLASEDGEGFLPVLIRFVHDDDRLTMIVEDRVFLLKRDQFLGALLGEIHVGD